MSDYSAYDELMAGVWDPTMDDDIKFPEDEFNQHYGTLCPSCGHELELIEHATWRCEHCKKEWKH